MINKNHYLIILFILFSMNSFSQFEVNIKLKIDTNNVCQADTVVFTALTTNGADTIGGVTYKWNFDDGSFQSGLELDTIKHVFQAGGGYIVRVEATKGTDSDYDLKKIQVSLTADFSKTESDRPDPICLGQLVRLQGSADTVDWKYKILDENIELNPVEIEQLNEYSSVFDYKAFTELQTITATSDIDTIGIKLEHTNLSDIQIELICPQDSSVILKSFGGQDKFFGEPNIPDPDQAGTGYYYYWTNTPDFGTINNAITVGESLPEGNYESEQAFSNLIGCSLNGEWTMKITDNQAADSGFVFAVRLKFNDLLLPPDWEFENTYVSPIWIGDGISNTTSEGLANATPTSEGNSQYRFRVTDNFGCKQDTSLFVNVEGASFTADPIEGPFELDVTFTNTTSWATNYVWEFGDESDSSTEENPTHTYTYPDGTYKVIFTAQTDDDCEDVDTLTIKVTIPDPVFNEPPNVFTPNNDGVNDIFKLDVDDLAGLEGWIYSRWGKTVSRWKSVEDAKSGWNGKILESNSDAVPGVYYFYIKAVDYHGEEIFKKGSVQLYR